MLKNGTLSIKKELAYLHLKDFLKYECELHLKQPLTPPQCKIIAAYRTSNHSLAIEPRQWSTNPIFEIINYPTFSLTM